MEEHPQLEELKKSYWKPFFEKLFKCTANNSKLPLRPEIKKFFDSVHINSNSYYDSNSNYLWFFTKFILNKMWSIKKIKDRAIEASRTSENIQTELSNNTDIFSIIDTIKDNLEQSKERLRLLDDSLNQVVAENRLRNEELERVEAQITDFKKKITDLKNEISKINLTNTNNNDHLSNQVVTLRHQYRQLNTNMSDLATTMNNLRNAPATAKPNPKSSNSAQNPTKESTNSSQNPKLPAWILPAGITIGFIFLIAIVYWIFKKK